jgi:hypothetical protein
MIVIYDCKTFIVQATDLLFAYVTGANQNGDTSL